MKLDNSAQDTLISVIIPMYNRERTIVECLNSVCHQTYSNIEILVIDDCSSDNSTQLVITYPDNRVKLIKLAKNSGAQVARNKGIEEAKGEWIAFNDSDDIWHVEKLEKQVEILKENNFCKNIVIHSNCFCFDEKNNKKWVWNVPRTEGACFKLLLERPAPLFPTLLVSKEALIRHGMLDADTPSYQEWDTSIKLSEDCTFIHIHDPLFTYVFHNGETISKDKRRDLDGFLYIVMKYKEEMKENGFYDHHINFLILRSIEFHLFDYAEKILDMKHVKDKKFILFKILIKYKISNKYILNVMRKIAR